MQIPTRMRMTPRYVSYQIAFTIHKPKVIKAITHQSQTYNNILSPTNILCLHLPFTAAWHPYNKSIVSYHSLGQMTIECTYCYTLHWIDKCLTKSSLCNPAFSTCCLQSKVALQPLQPPPDPLCFLLINQTRTAKAFQQNIWEYNCAFGFTSISVDFIDRSVNNGCAAPVFSISGELYHLLGFLEAEDRGKPIYSQLYVLYPSHKLQGQVDNNQCLKTNLLHNLQYMLHQYHAYILIYQYAYEWLRNVNTKDTDYEIHLRLAPGLDHWCYNLPTTNKVTVMLAGPYQAEPCDIVLHQQHNSILRHISNLHPGYLPLSYPLLFAREENGWHESLILAEDNNVRSCHLAQAQKRRDQRQDCIP